MRQMGLPFFAHKMITLATCLPKMITSNIVRINSAVIGCRSLRRTQRAQQRTICFSIGKT